MLRESRFELLPQVRIVGGAPWLRLASHLGLGCRRLADLLGAEDAVFAQSEAAVQPLLELTDVARPIMAKERPHRACAERDAPPRVPHPCEEQCAQDEAH